MSAKVSKTRTLVECAIMIALATILSLFKIVDLPYGGSVTVASMFPIIVIAYRHGMKWGFASAGVFSIIQQLFGLKNLSYATSWQAVIAIMLLDYIIAFTVLGFGGIFKKVIKVQAPALVLGSLAACALRYICHVISGATVWAGLSIPTEAALTYSFIYNATYMLPETIVTMLVAFYLGTALDFNSAELKRIVKNKDGKLPVAGICGGLFVTGGLITLVAGVFAQLQNADSGEFDITGIANVNWPVIGIVSCVLICLGFVGLLTQVMISKKK